MFYNSLQISIFLCFIQFATITTFTTNITEESIIQLDRVKKEIIEVEKAVAATCIPEKQVIKLGPPPDSSQYYYPSCTRVDRCGGCCTQDDLLSCQPVEKVIVNFQVTVGNYNGNRRHTEIIPVEKHTKCRCQCIIKKENCSALQEYNKKDCSCTCINRDERAKCDDDPLNKSWDPHSCTCNCHQPKECPNGIFNKHTCSCEPQRTLIRNTGVRYYPDS